MVYLPGALHDFGQRALEERDSLAEPSSLLMGIRKVVLRGQGPGMICTRTRSLSAWARSDEG